MNEQEIIDIGTKVFVKFALDKMELGHLIEDEDYIVLTTGQIIDLIYENDEMVTFARFYYDPTKSFDDIFENTEWTELDYTFNEIVRIRDFLSEVINRRDER